MFAATVAFLLGCSGEPEVERVTEACRGRECVETTAVLEGAFLSWWSPYWIPSAPPV